VKSEARHPAVLDGDESCRTWRRVDGGDEMPAADGPFFRGQKKELRSVLVSAGNWAV